MPTTRSQQPRYADRRHAGETLADELAGWSGGSPVVVLALPRGGVPVAAPVADRQTAPLGVLVVAKVGVPGQPELAMGALAAVGNRVELVRNERVITSLGIGDRPFQQAVQRESAALARRVDRFGRRAATPVAGRTVLIVDDGLATGSTMLAAVTAVRRQQAAEVVVAVPVGSADAVALLRQSADSVLCPWVPEPFSAVGHAYADFTQVADGEVDRLLG